MCGWSCCILSSRVHLIQLFLSKLNQITSLQEFSFPLTTGGTFCTGSFSPGASLNVHRLISCTHPQPTRTHLCTRLPNLHIPDFGQSGIHSTHDPRCHEKTTLDCKNYSFTHICTLSNKNTAQSSNVKS